MSLFRMSPVVRGLLLAGAACSGVAGASLAGCSSAETPTSTSNPSSSSNANAGTIGLSLTLVHLIGIPLDGTSVNPARSLGPALFVGGDALSQLWVFIVAPLVGAILSAAAYLALYPQGEAEATVAPAPEEQAA